MFRNTLVRNFLLSLVLTTGLIASLTLVKRNQDIKTEAAGSQTIECSDWCAGNDQCYAAKGRRPASGQMCNYASCSAGNAPCCANGVCGTKTVTTSSGQTCNTDSRTTDAACFNKKDGTVVSGGTCRMANGGCRVIKETQSVGTSKLTCTVKVGNKNVTLQDGQCGCNIPGYEKKLCVGNNEWYTRTVCEKQCNPQASIPVPANGTACNSLQEEPDDSCQNKKVGDKKCFGESGTCSAASSGVNKYYCECRIN